MPDRLGGLLPSTRFGWALLIALIPDGLLAGCASSGVAPEPPTDQAVQATRCPAVRPRVCTMEYAPVCAQLKTGGVQTYSSRCNACADIAVSTWQPNPCEEL